MFYLCYFVDDFFFLFFLFFFGTARWWLYYTESDCFQRIGDVISAANEVAQLHTIVDWMRDEDLDYKYVVKNPPPHPTPSRPHREEKSV